MRIILQRITRAEVIVGERQVGKCGPGLAVFVAVGREDTEVNADYLVEKITHLRVFEDAHGKMNRSILDVEGEILVVSEFTLYGNCSKGTRPSFSHAASPADARRLYDYFVARLRASGRPVATGEFQTGMKVSVQNDGPVTLMLEK